MHRSQIDNRPALDFYVGDFVLYEFTCKFREKDMSKLSLLLPGQYVVVKRKICRERNSRAGNG